MGIIKLGMHSRVKRILELLVVSCQESGRLILSEEEHGRRRGKKYQLQQRAWKQGRDLAAAISSRNFMTASPAGTMWTASRPNF